MRSSYRVHCSGLLRSAKTNELLESFYATCNLILSSLDTVSVFGTDSDVRSGVIQSRVQTETFHRTRSLHCTIFYNEIF